MKSPTENHLTAQQLFADPRIAEARRLITASLSAHTHSLTAVRPPNAELKIAYADVLKHFAEQRAGNLFFPYLGSGGGHGPFVELADGSVKMDLICGIGVHHFGHSHPRLVSAAVDAALRDTVMQGNLQQNAESANLADILLQRTGEGSKITRAFFTSSGAMANENALKLAFHKRPVSGRILAFDHAFAGRTLALAAITDKAAYRTGLPLALPVDYLPFFDAPRPAESIARAVAALQALIARYPGQHAALWCEFVQGEGGFYPGSTEFFAALFNIAREHKIAIVADEVQTFGRTSRLFAFQHFAVEEFIDIVTIGKMLQVCATLFTDALRPAPGLLSQTFTASTSAILAADVILRELLAPELFGDAGRNSQVHTRFVQRFEEIRARHPAWITGPYGIGGMIAFTPFDGSEDKVKKLLHALFERGLIAFYCGAHPARLRFLPPVPVLTDAHIDTASEILEAALAQVAGEGGGTC